MLMAKHVVPIVLLWMGTVAGRAGAVEYPGARPGAATGRQNGARITLENAALAATWEASKGGPVLVEVAERPAGGALRGKQGQGLTIHLAGGRTIATGQLRLQGEPVLERIGPRTEAAPLGQRAAGWQARARFASEDGTLNVEWQATLRDDANYLRQEVTLTARGADVPAEKLTMIDVEAAAAEVRGTVEGSPVVAGRFFLGCEHPMGQSAVTPLTPNPSPILNPESPIPTQAGPHPNPLRKGEGTRWRAVCSVPVYGPLRRGESCTRSCVLGVVPRGQLRRGFLYYLERERPRPYQPFLHYNSWYDISWGDRKFNEEQSLAAIEIFGRELVEKRGVRLDGLVFDDGWDDNKTLWLFHGGFPHGFAPLAAAAAKYHSAVGVWLSPWGGYDQAQQARLKYGKTQGFETNSRGFSLAGPVYYARFRDVCRKMIEQYGVNHFKFDGLAQGLLSTGPGSCARDAEAMLRLIGELRGLRPGLYVNVTTGSWPSPFWLLHADSIWRDGGDMGFAGAGSKRQQWITYRDMIEYQRIVGRGPLFPLSSLMTQGIAQSRHGDAAGLGSDLQEFRDEARSFFASGTQCQELYVAPQLLTPGMWDAIADGALWSRRNADVLADVHWVGGDPGKGEPYGFAAWSPRQGMLALRNPAARPAAITLDIGQALEVPGGGPQEFRLVCPWKDAAAGPSLVVRAGRPQTFRLAAFEVLVFDAMPRL
jgi:hypothetical protein